MRRQLAERTLLSTMSIAVLALGGLGAWIDAATADDVVPGSVVARPAFEDAVAGDELTGALPAGCVVCDQAASVGACTRCDRAVARPLAPLGGWLDPADDNDVLLLPLVPPAQTAHPGLTLPAPWWSQLPTPSVRSAKTLLVSDLSAKGPSLSAAPSLETSFEFTSSCQLAPSCPSCPSSACQSGNCEHAAFESVTGGDSTTDFGAVFDDVRVCAGEVCAGEVCTREGQSCSECAAASVCTAQECAGKDRTAKTCESSQCPSEAQRAPEAVASDSCIEQPVAEIIEIIDSLGESVVSGTLFDGAAVEGAAACTDSTACRGDGSCTHSGQCATGDGSCPTTRAALIAELRNLAAAEATASDIAGTASGIAATASGTEETGCPPQNGIPTSLAAQAAACEASVQPYSVLAVQNPYVSHAGETTINVISHRQAASRVDATADTLEVDGLYEAADMLRQIADELRLEARQQALSAASRAVPPNAVPYPPAYRAVPNLTPPLPVAPEAYQPTGQWSLPVLEAFRGVGEQPPVR